MLTYLPSAHSYAPYQCAPPSSAFAPRSSVHTPAALRPKMLAMSSAAPSTIAASITCPRLEERASDSAHTMPNARSMPPPPKSPTRFSGGTGRSPARPNGDKGGGNPHQQESVVACSGAGGAVAGSADRVQRAGHRDVVDVVPGGRGQRPVLPPARHPRVDQPGVALEAGF